MVTQSEDSSDEWCYAPYGSLRAELQRGHGSAVTRLRDQPEHAQLVYECAGRDTRWDWQVDDRYTYLARLVRDLCLDPAPLVAQLRSCGPYRSWPHQDLTDVDNRFDLAVGILGTLARAGYEQARAALRGYVHDGARWSEVLETMAEEWPVEWWDDLWETAAGRAAAGDASELWPEVDPWRRWRGRDPRLDALLDAVGRDRPEIDRPQVDDLAPASDAELVALLRAPGVDRATVGSVLRQIRRRGHPVPELLDLVGDLAAVRPPGLLGALRALGPLIVPAARAWADDPTHPMFADAPHLLARYADEQDQPVLFAALDRRADQWCGYD